MSNEQVVTAAEPSCRKAGRPFGTKRGGHRYLSQDELVCFFKMAKAERPENHLLLALAYTYAMRVSEVVSLRWSDIDIPSRRITIQGLKRGRVQVYAIQPDLWRLVARHLRRREAGETWLFPARSRIAQGPNITAQTAKSLFQRVAAKAGIVGHSIHSLRGAQAMSMARDSSGQCQIAGWLRHKDVRSSLAYTVPVVDAALEAAQARRTRRYL